MDERQRAQYRMAFGEEYTKFLEVWHSVPLRECPCCGGQTIRVLWLGDPGFTSETGVWGKWYRWCTQCLKGIRCPLGSYRVPVGEPYIPWGDDEALGQALPADLRLILPIGSTPDDQKKTELQKRFDAALGIRPKHPS